MRIIKHPGELTVIAMQPYFFPYIGYFQLLGIADRIVFLDDVQFTRKGWINRNRIADVYANEFSIVLPLKSSPRETPINQMCLSETFSPEKLMKTIEHTYSKFEHFATASQILKPILFSEITNLSDWLTNSIREINRYIQIENEFIFSSNIPNPENLRGQERIVQICNWLDATNYVNLSGGRELYSPEYFKNAGVQIYFLDSMLTKYQRKGSKFIPGLSIIDLLMNVDRLTLISLIKEDYALSTR